MPTPDTRFETERFWFESFLIGIWKHTCLRLNALTKQEKFQYIFVNYWLSESILRLTLFLCFILFHYCLCNFSTVSSDTVYYYWVSPSPLCVNVSGRQGQNLPNHCVHSPGHSHTYQEPYYTNALGLVSMTRHTHLTNLPFIDVCIMIKTIFVKPRSQFLDHNQVKDHNFSSLCIFCLGDKILLSVSS